MSDSVTPWTVASQAPLSMGFSRQEYWSGLPLPSPGDLFNPGVKPESLMSLALQADSLLLSHQGSLYFFLEIRKFIMKKSQTNTMRNFKILSLRGKSNPINELNTG